jgi:hypothetical protein
MDGGVPDTVERYVEDLRRAPLATRTRDAYASHVGAYGRWLTGRPEAPAALVEPRARDHAARDFKRHLKLEQFDRVHGELLLRVRAQSEGERLADGEALDEAGRTLMDACRVVLDDAVAEPVRDAVFAAVQRNKLADAVSAMARLARSPDDRARELVSRKRSSSGRSA